MRERTRVERVIMKSSVAKHYGCKRVKQCGLIADAGKRIEINSPIRYNIRQSSLREKVSIHPEHRTVAKLTISVRTWQRSPDSPRTPNCRWTHYISTHMTAKSWFIQNTELSVNSLYQYVHDSEVLIHPEHRTVAELTISVRTWQRSLDSLRTPNCR